MNTIKVSNGKVQMVAHRGLSGLERENTCAAFVAAGNRATYYGIETDVHRTLDGRFVVFHDDDTERIGIDHLEIEKSTWKTLRGLQLTDIDNTRSRSDLVVASLLEYISICKRYEKVCVLELKNEFNKEDVGRIIEEIRTLDYLDHVTFISFSLQNLLYVREYLPGHSAQWLIWEEFNEEHIEKLVQHKIDLDIHYALLTKELVERLHEAGITINCWTVDTKEEAEMLIAMGVDQITTNIVEGLDAPKA